MNVLFPVCPGNVSWLADDFHEAICYDAYCELSKLFPDRVAKMMEDNSHSTEPSFVGFLGIYKSLAEIIPLDRTVYDLGCSYGFQSWIFREHHRYVGVDISRSDFGFPLENAEWHTCGIIEFIETMKLDYPSFAILNAVPSFCVNEPVAKAFPHHFILYPESRHRTIIERGGAFKQLKLVQNNQIMKVEGAERDE